VTDSILIGRETRKGVESLVYETPSETFDPNEAANSTLRLGIQQLLERHYFGHGWRVKASVHHRVAAFNIPELMGETLHQVVKLNELGGNDAIIVKLGGDLLERMGLRRGPANLDEVREAKKRMHTFQFGDVKQ
jgi:hypothetical protein